mmetsp:Transcript_16367/g.38490  ORF Transcript_16367/g.38490 Transcript_16367/m.38490 type:complete len:208 (+) Transcript_16367:1965-2588(+)
MHSWLPSFHLSRSVAVSYPAADAAMSVSSGSFSTTASAGGVSITSSTFLRASSLSGGMTCHIPETSEFTESAKAPSSSLHTGQICHLLLVGPLDCWKMWRRRLVWAPAVSSSMKCGLLLMSSGCRRYRPLSWVPLDRVGPPSTSRASPWKPSALLTFLTLRAGQLAQPCCVVQRPLMSGPSEHENTAPVGWITSSITHCLFAPAERK